jgi:hypothetical protein
MAAVAQASITGRNTGTAAQYRGGHSSGSPPGPPSTSNTQTCDACSIDGNKAKLTSLTLRYLATSVGGNNNDQGEMGDKWMFSGNNWPSTGSVTITARDKKSQVIETFTVSTNGVFTLEPSKFDSETHFTFTGGGVVQIHTSCSVPLRVNDQFGPLVVVDFGNDGGVQGSACQSQPCGYEYVIPPPPPLLPKLTLTDMKNRAED